MAHIHKTTHDPLDINGQLMVPAMMFPSFRLARAKELGVEKKMVMRTHGGLGDVICAEPAIRWAVKHFKGSELMIDTHFPELFGHLGIPINDMKRHILESENHLVYDSLYTTEVLAWEFMVHMFMHSVDYHAMTMWKTQLPIADKSIVLTPSDEDFRKAGEQIILTKDIVIHAGRTWQSRTIPPWFWDKVIAHLVANGARPLLIGKESHALVGNLKISTEGCLDLRDKLSIMETVAVLQYARVLLSNDSSPVHMAASGDAAIGVISTVRHPEFITHWRHGKFGWGMKNFSSGGVWQNIEMCPNAMVECTVDSVDQDLLESWLPDPIDFANWGLQCLHNRIPIPL